MFEVTVIDYNPKTTGLRTRHSKEFVHLPDALELVATAMREGNPNFPKGGENGEGECRTAIQVVSLNMISKQMSVCFEYYSADGWTF